MAINSDGLALLHSAAKFFLHSAGKEKIMDIGDLTHRQTEDLGNKMGGMPGIKRFLSGELVLIERNAVPPTVISQDFSNGGVTFSSALNDEAFLDDWSKFLRDIFKLGLSSRKKINLPKTRPGFGWGIITPKGMTIERALQGYAGICPIWRWTNDNLDGKTKSVRNADNTRVVWVHDRIEADEEQKNKSYSDLQIAGGVGGVTLLERLLLGRWFYYRTSQHLDVSTVTRCDGSMYSDGDVPGVNWGGYYSKLNVCRYYPDYRCNFLRSREAVSLV